ncbi:class I SAM-dependent methyltransferase [Pseudoduganella sp. LjRoot289]|uniref:class I SAM-dependent methyltransferase n=1 Tax=Pseudoduganella sp. LjRoot289 TaxID=3342314 RepID=UPI003ECC63CF
MSDNKYLSIVEHYEDCLARHGDTAAGVDWPNERDAQTRYQVMLGVMRGQREAASLLDFGCGAAHLYQHALREGLDHIDYAGLDVSEKFVALSREKFPDRPFYCLDVLRETDQLPEFDYIVMNGVFTEKRALSQEEMFAYFKEMITKVFEKSRRGIAFNVMSKCVDWERDDLFHLSTDLLLEFLTKHVSRHVVIRNDYGLYEYTTYVYKGAHRE